MTPSALTTRAKPSRVCTEENRAEAHAGRGRRPGVSAAPPASHSEPQKCPPLTCFDHLQQVPSQRMTGELGHGLPSPSPGPCFSNDRKVCVH